MRAHTHTHTHTHPRPQEHLLTTKWCFPTESLQSDPTEPISLSTTSDMLALQLNTTHTQGRMWWVPQRYDPPPKHTHTHTHTRADADAHTYTHILITHDWTIYTHLSVGTCSYSNIWRKRHTHTDIHTHTQIHKHSVWMLSKHPHTHTHTHTRIDMCTWTSPYLLVFI